jgi:hypothetical protein
MMSHLVASGFAAACGSNSCNSYTERQQSVRFLRSERIDDLDLVGER